MQKQKRQDLGTNPVKLEKETLPLGFDSFVMARQVVSVCIPEGNAAKALRDKFRDQARLFDFTCGRRVRSMVITNSGHLILSAVHCETVRSRLEQLGANGARAGTPAPPEQAPPSEGRLEP